MKKTKRILSVVLVVLMVCSIFFAVPTTASAAREACKTQAEAVSWLNSQGGAAYNIDTSTEGTQCVEFVRAYVNWLVTGNAWSDVWFTGKTGHGYEIWTNALWGELDWKVYQNTADFLPQPGDIFSSGTTAYGHTGVVISSDLNTAVVAEANVDKGSDGKYHGSPVKVHTITWRSASSNSPYGATHYIRPVFKSTPPPTPKPSNAKISCNKTISVAGDNVTFTFSADNAAGFTIGINKNGTRIITEDVSSGKTYTFSEAGSYSAYVTAWNSTGSVDSNTVSFSVFEPSDVGKEFTASLIHVKSGTAVTYRNGNVGVGEFEDSEAQKWHFIRMADKSYKIENIDCEECLDDANFGTSNGTNIGVCRSNDSTAQRWYFRRNGAGYSLVPKCAQHMCMDLEGGNTGEGNNIALWEYLDNHDNKIFSLEYTMVPMITVTSKGHKYEFYDFSVSWNTAYKLCEKLGGHLVTINSPEENDLIKEHGMNLTKDSFIWLGGTDVWREGNWYWVTGEDFPENGWASGEPNNDGGNENYLHMTNKNGEWNDIAQSSGANYDSIFVCEYENDIDISKYTPSFITMYNDHEYWYYDSSVDWQTANKICTAKGGHLVTIESAAENTNIQANLSMLDKDEIWLGYTDRENEGVWLDYKGQPMTYNNWKVSDSEPNNSEGIEDYAQMYSDGTWNDIKGFSFNYRSIGFVCEFDKISLFNSDGTRTVEPAKTFENNNHNYELYDVSLCWEDAKEACEKMGGHLVTITSQDEQDVIEFLLNKGSKTQYWIGLKDCKTTEEWITGEKIDYNNWASGEPNVSKRADGETENFAQILNADNPKSIAGKKFKWNDSFFDNTFPGEEDYFCLGNIGFICEYEEPSSQPTDPTETEPVETQPIETQPTESEPVDTQPVETQPTESEPIDTQPVETQPTETEPIETQPIETQPDKKDISGWEVEGLKNKTYTGKVLKQDNILVSYDGEYADFTIQYKNNVKVGTATVTITGTGDYTGKITKTFKIVKAKNPITAKAVSKTVKLKDVKKKTVTVKKAIRVKKNQGSVSYAEVKNGTTKGVSISKGGVITIKKGAVKKKTTLTIIVKVTAKGNENYKNLTKKVTVKIKVK